MSGCATINQSDISFSNEIIMLLFKGEWNNPIKCNFYNTDDDDSNNDKNDSKTQTQSQIAQILRHTHTHTSIFS